MKAPKPPEWDTMTDWQRVQWRIGWRVGRVLRAIVGSKPPPPSVPSEPDPLMFYGQMKRWRDKLEGTNDIISALEAVDKPPKERP